MNSHRTIAWYAATIFLSSALLLALEIVAGRLIAPFVGVSLYTWTAVIGVILAGLSVGNWLGGVWADRGAGERAAGLVLVGSALACVAIPLLLAWVAPVIQASALSLLSASLLLVLSLFMLPALLLGVVTPLLTTLALKLSPRTGHVVGMMHALAALGSIIGTFTAGYWLIPALGSRALVLGTALMLFVLALPLLRRSHPVLPGGLGALALIVLAASGSSGALDDPCDRESSYFCIRVVDESWEMPPGRLRSLVLDHLMHGSNHEQEPGLLAAPYVQLMDELVQWRFGDRNGLRFFFVGGGAYTQPRATLARYPQSRVTVAELDPTVTEVARERLFVDTSAMEIHHADARSVLARHPQRRFEVIVGDAFHDIAVPYHLVTLEFARTVGAHLAPGGLYTLNLVDAFPDARLVKSLVKTLEQVFPSVQIWLDGIPEEPTRVTYVVSAGDRPFPELLTASRGLPRQWLDVTEPLLAAGTPASQLPLLTDDHAPVERLMAALFLTPLGR
jgi:hypothetical protein